MVEDELVETALGHVIYSANHRHSRRPIVYFPCWSVVLVSLRFVCIYISFTIAPHSCDSHAVALLLSTYKHAASSFRAGQRPRL